MSFHGIEVVFSVYQSGHWVKNHRGEISYQGGENKSIECYADEIFSKLPHDELHGQKIWYKLPFEDNKERKLLRNVGTSFEAMIEAAKWCGLVEIFMVNEADHPTDELSHQPYEEECRVERNVAGFIDEDLEFDYHNTPPNSDDEEEGDKLARCKKGGGELKMNQVFDTLDDFKDALVDYAMNDGWNIKQNRWGKIKSGAICGIGDGCSWRIYCSYEEHLGKWKVKTFEDVHSCLKDGKSKILKASVIAKMFLDDFRTDPDFKPKTMQNQIQQRFNLMTTIDKCKKAKAKAISIINRDHEEQFSRLKDYRLAVLEQNKESTVELETVTNEAGNEIFSRFYVCFEVLKKKWTTWCRPIFGVDGCFMKCTLKGQLLAAVGRDANNGMYPFAWVVVDVENEDNWTWFLRKLKIDLSLQEGQGFTIISDRQKGMLNAVQRELPHIEHRMCARHIYGNLKKIFPNQSDMKALFWRVAESYTLPEYNANLERVKDYDMRLYEAMMEKNPQNCSLAFCSPSASCVDVHNNISESFNNAIDPERYMPVVEMLETIRRRSMVRIDKRSKEATSHQGRVTVRAMEWIDDEQKKLKYCLMVPGANERHEVRESGVSYSVNMRLRTCVCRRWEMSGLPCRHALRVIAGRNLNREDYVAHWFLNSTQQQIYSDSIRPVNGMLFWGKTGSKVIPPPSLVEEIANRLGRKPKPKRKKARHESPTNKKASREKMIIHCGRCGQVGHNATKCQNMVVEKAKKKAQKARNRQHGEDENELCQDGYESMTLDFGEGSTQPTQD